MDKEKALAHAQRKFQEHVASYVDLDSVSILTWAKPGKIDYNMRYVFDKKGRTITISGDLGYAIVCPTCKVDLPSCAKAFQWVDYFAEKIRASSDMYDYDEEEAEATLREYLLRDAEPEERKDREDLISELLDHFDRFSGLGCLDEDLQNRLSHIDPDSWEWLGTLGRQYDLRVYLWMYGLQMAWRQLGTSGALEKSAPSKNVWYDYTVNIGGGEASGSFLAPENASEEYLALQCLDSLYDYEVTKRNGEQNERKGN